MNLYEIMLKHFAPRGSEQGIFTYLIAGSDEEVYEWLKTNPSLSDGRSLNTPFDDYENDKKMLEIYNVDYEIVGHETYREKIIRLKGDLNDDDVELSDLYYGQTLVGWDVVKLNITMEQMELLKDSGICIQSK